jgi:hypothetical protein
MVMMAVMMVVAVTILMRMIGAFDIAPAREHEDVPVGVYDLDVRAVEFR